MNPEDSPDFGDSLANTFEASPMYPHSQGLLHPLHFCYVVLQYISDDLDFDCLAYEFLSLLF